MRSITLAIVALSLAASCGPGEVRLRSEPRQIVVRLAPDAHARVTPPVRPAPAPRRVEERRDAAVDVAMGIGGGALVVGALGMAANADSGSDAGFVFGGVTLGISVVALSTAGILTLVHEDDEEQVSLRAGVSPVGAGLEVRF